MSKRLNKELQLIKMERFQGIFDVSIIQNNIFLWCIALFPQEEPYKGIFKVKLEFSIDYPLKSPNLTFQTQIYHPNVDEKGEICLPILQREHWNPAIKVYDIILAVMDLLNRPNLDNPLRADIAKEYSIDRFKFMQSAKEFTNLHSEKLPDLS